MICEICGQNKEEARIFSINGMINYISCTPCSRIVDNLIYTEEIKYKSQIIYIVNELIHSKENKQ